MSHPGRVLVTGASGFVGRALVQALGRAGRQVTAAVRGDHSFPDGVRRVRIAAVGPDTDWTEALAGCTSVVHLAARVHQVSDSELDPLAAYRHVNLAGTLSLARQAAAGGIARLVFISSVKVNGEATLPGRPFRESDPPAPVDPYGISKAEAESALFQLRARGSPLEVVVVRPPLVYGPGVKANFRSLMVWLSRGIPLPFGSLRHNRRSLLGLENLVSLLELCLVHPAAAGEVFLAGDGEDLSTAELLRRAAEALQVPARLFPVPLVLLEAAARVAGKGALLQRLCGNLQVDSTRARQLLGWRPPSTVAEELARTASAFRAERGSR